jgi:acetyltransferase-like isoleucine patch superfamily enzyme
MKPFDSLRSHGLEIGKSSVQGWLDFQAPVRIGQEAVLRNAVIGAYTYLETRSEMINALVGRYGSIAGDARLGLSRHEPGAATTHPFPALNFFAFHVPEHRPKPWADPNLRCVVVEDDVWIGAHAMIVGHRPVRIGRGAIVAAGAVVTADVAPYAIVGGNPARVIGQRFADSVCADMAKISWCDFDLPRYAAAHPDDPPPMQVPKDFLAWWSDGAVQRLEGFRLAPGHLRLERAGRDWRVRPSPASWTG